MWFYSLDIFRSLSETSHGKLSNSLSSRFHGHFEWTRSLIEIEINYIKWVKSHLFLGFVKETFLQTKNNNTVGVKIKTTCSEFNKHCKKTVNILECSDYIWHHHGNCNHTSLVGWVICEISFENLRIVGRQETFCVVNQ